MFGMAAVLSGSFKRTFINYAPGGGPNAGRTTVQQVGIGSTSSDAADDVTATLPGRVNGNINLSGRIQVIGGGIPSASVSVLVSTDGGATFPQSQVLGTAAGTFNINIPGVFAAEGQCVLRFSVSAGQDVDLATTTVNYYCFATFFNTDNYPIEYESK